MANLRESWANTVVAPMDWGLGERPIDRIAAGGFADTLGITLWRVKYQNSVTDYHKAAEEIFTRLSKKYPKTPPEMTRKLVDNALHEYLAPFCTACNGRKELVIANLRVICKTCDGAGIKRYTDQARANYMSESIAIVKQYSKRLNSILDMLNTYDAQVNPVMVEQLER